MAEKPCNLLKNGGGMNKWTCLYEFTNTGFTEHSITLPTSGEILLEVSVDVSSYGRIFTQVIPRERFTSSKEVFYLGGGYTSSGGVAYYSYASLTMSSSTVALNNVAVNGATYESIATIRIYAR